MGNLSPQSKALVYVDTRLISSPHLTFLILQSAITAKGNMLLMETYGPSSRWIDVGLTGSVTGLVDFTATSSASFVTLTPASGSLSTASPERRVELSVDWDKATTGNVTVTLTGGGTTLTLNVPITVRMVPDGFKGFVEGDGVISIEAEHFTKNNEVNGAKWAGLPGYGKTLGAITPYPVLSKLHDSLTGVGPNEAQLQASGQERVHLRWS